MNDCLPCLSNYDSESELSKLCAAPKETWTPINRDLNAVLVHSLPWHSLSAGKFDITVGPLTQLWRAQRKKQQLPSLESIENAKQRCGWSSVKIDGPVPSRPPKSPVVASLLKDQMVLDVSGIAVGYIIDAAFEKMRVAVLRSILINAATALAVLGMQCASELFDGMPITQAVLMEAGPADGPVRERWLAK